MLKGFVSGEEKDIVRIPMKGRNLFDKNSDTINNTGASRPGVDVAAGTYSISNGTATAVYYRVGYSGTTVQINAGRTVENIVADDRFYVWRDNNVRTDGVMLNLGSTALPYEPYGYQEGWEVRDSQDRLIWGREDELQTATGTLPFKGYSLPVKVKSLLGNAVQNGTPAPDNITIPEMCGVLNENLAIIDTDSYSLNNWYYEDTRLTGLLPPGTYTISFVTDSVTTGATTDGTIGIGTTSDYTEDLEWFTRAAVGSMTTVTVTLSESNCLWARFVRDHNIVRITCSISVSKIRVEEGSTAYGWKVPFENHGENLFDAAAAYGAMYSNGTISGELSALAGVKNTFPPEMFGQKITISVKANSIQSNRAYIRCNIGGTDIDSNAVTQGNTGTMTVTVTPTSSSDKWWFTYGSGMGNNTFSNIMLNIGSTPKPYSPYLNETIPVYLGKVPTVRRVKKLVLDGTEENIEQSSTYYNISSINPSCIDRNTFVCSHFDKGDYTGPIEVGKARFGGSQLDTLVINYDGGSGGVNSFKAWLADEYAAGHPVTVWYVLNTEETTISNEPLCKISTYADELTTIQVHGLSAPLYGIGDYKDTLNLSTGVVTRKVKRLVLTGTEDWAATGSSTHSWRVVVPSIVKPSTNAVVASIKSSHYKAITFNESYSGFPTGVGVPASSNWIDVCDRSISSLADFKQFLATKYANGTPVCIWYVLETPTTETVTVPTGMTGEIEGYLTQVSTPTPTNRSVPKWNGVEESGGTYAVTVYTPPEIPTTTGENTLTVETEKIHGLTNPLCGIGDYKDVLNLSTGVITRKVKKLVLDGTEDWLVESGVNGLFTLPNIVPQVQYADQICSHFSLAPSYLNFYNNDLKFAVINRPALVIHYNAKQTVPAFKQWLAEEYAAGHPVTIWYILDTPETETITVPYGLECSVEGYLTQSGTPAPSSPITPDSNGILESGGTYAVEVSLVPSNLTVKGHIKEMTQP